jgi:UDP-arabinose 4-epimerase
MHVLVTGGAGYVGSHACKALSRAGFTPVVYDDLSKGHRDFVRWGPLVEGSIGDTAKVRAAIRAHDCQAVLHFAAFAYVGESVTDPKKYVHNNVCQSAALLDAVLEEKVSTFILSSTCAVYGLPEKMPIVESSPLGPVNPYGESKRYLETMLRDYGVAYGLKWTALRYFNAAGADADGEIGEIHDPETHLIPLAIEAAEGRGEPLKVMGTDYPTPDGTAIRDYIHVSDLATAHVAALKRLASGRPSGIINLGTGHGNSVMEVVSAVSRATGRQVPWSAAPRRAGDPPVLVADASLARTELGWTPIHSSLETIVETAVRWHRR